MATSWLDHYRNKRVLVTGGTGFLGRHVVGMLNDAGAKVVSVGSRDVNLHYPVREDRWVPYDMIFHLAAKVSGISKNRLHPFEYLHDNALINTNIVNYALRTNTPIVAAGSVCVYSNKAPLPFKEEDIFVDEPERSNYGYGLSKRLLLNLLQAASLQESTFCYAFVNPANLYGPGDNFFANAHVIPDLIKKVDASVANGNQVKIMGTGKATRDFLYVEDAARAFVMAGEYLLEEGKSILCNIGSGHEVSILDVLKIICAILDRKPLIVPDSSVGDGQPRRLVNSTEAHKLLGWRPSVSIGKGLEKTVEWYCTDVKQPKTHHTANQGHGAHRA